MGRQMTTWTPDTNFWRALPNERCLQTNRDARPKRGGRKRCTRRHLVHERTISGQYCRIKGPCKQVEKHTLEVREGGRVHQTRICIPNGNFEPELPNAKSLQTKRYAQTGGGRKARVRQTTICIPDDNFGPALPDERSLQTNERCPDWRWGREEGTTTQFVHQQQF